MITVPPRSSLALVLALAPGCTRAPPESMQPVSRPLAAVTRAVPAPAPVPVPAPAPAPVPDSDGDGIERGKPISFFHSAPSPKLHFDKAPAGRGARAGAGADGFVEVVAAQRPSVDLRREPAAFHAVRRLLTKGKLPWRAAFELGALLNAFAYDDPPPADGPLALTAELGPCPWNPAHRLVRIGLKARAVAPPPRAVVVLVPTSSEYYGFREPSSAMQSALTQLFDELRPDDRIALGGYGGGKSLILPMVPVSERDTILDALARLKDDDARPRAQDVGFRRAYTLLAAERQRQRSIIVFGDYWFGRWGPGAAEEFRSARAYDAHIAPAARSGVSLALLDFNRGDYREFVPEWTAVTGGDYREITSPAALRRGLLSAVGSQAPVAHDVKLDLSFDPARVAAYRRLDDDQFGPAAAPRRRARGLDLRAGEGLTVLYEIVPTGSDAGGPVLTVTARARPARGAPVELRQLVHAPADASIAASSPDFRLAAAVAGMGLLLTDCAAHSAADYAGLTALVRSTVVAAHHDDRRELVGVIEGMQTRHAEHEAQRAALSRWMLDNTVTDAAARAAGSLSPYATRLLRGIGPLDPDFTGYAEISGHTDYGEGATLEALDAIALTRARIVATYLITNAGWDPDRIILRAPGAYESLDSGETAWGRSKNRRVELTLLNEH